ncbi:ALK tyrosine kinase receptor-like [Salvelinus sp. IW2-2015]|uniref:ALK tyrosine kinase receptor-like n=1 Tax=Salvelinus sp. IW2-2015 TaxID=2691554 RepID=UPI000CEA9928|nr:ALK tyrosine kinase receptor-like [Salvelinus alpinus]
MDCPLGDDEGDMCSQFLNGSYCSFEDGECGWQPTAAKGSSWRRVHTPPKGVRPSCSSSSGAMFSVDGGQSKGHQVSTLLRSPLFPPPLRNSRCEVRFLMCSGGGQRGALSLWLVENSTRPEEQRRLWHSANEPKTKKGWRRIIVPLYGLVDWYGGSIWSIDRETSDYGQSQP